MRTRKLTSLLLAFVLFFSVLQVSDATQVDAASKQRAAACKAYREILTENSVFLGEPGYTSAKNFNIVDINSDGIPELIFNGDKAYIVFTYNGKEATEIYETWVLENYYWDKSKKLFISYYKWNNEISIHVAKINKKKNGFNSVVSCMRDIDCSINGKDTTYAKAYKKALSYLKAKTCKPLKTPYAVNAKNIKKYVK